MCYLLLEGKKLLVDLKSVKILQLYNIKRKAVKNITIEFKKYLTKQKLSKRNIEMQLHKI